MDKKSRLWNKIYNYFSNMGLLKKLTTAYTIAILVPTIAAASYTYYQSMSNIKQEMVRSSERNLSQIDEDIDRKVTIIRGVGNNIAYNTKIQNLLYYGMEFTPEAINYYINSIATPIDYALNFSEANIYQIKVYFTNESVPEYGHFFKEDKVKSEEWFKEFDKSGKDEIWIYQTSSTNDKTTTDELDNTYKINKSEKIQRPVNEPIFRMIKKIRGVDGSNLGIVTIDILQEDLFSSLKAGIKNDEVFVLDGKNNIIYPDNYDESKSDLVLESFEKDNGYFFKKNILYDYKTVDPLGIKIINRTAISSLIRSALLASGYNILAVIIGIMLLEIITYFILKIIFSRLNQIVKVMNIVAKGNFDIRIPVNHKDEVGQIASSFNVLIEKINSLINDVIKKETAQKDAQLTALQYQINPHFIYNTIDIFRMKLELEGNYKMADSITYFGKMLRYNINRDSQYATIKEEVEYIEKYIHLQKLRYEEKLKFEVNVPVEFENIRIIRFMLQPIVENSIKHGIKETEKELIIRIKFEKKNDSLEMQVIDNGNGMNSEELDILNEQLKSSKALERKSFTDKNIGLENINSRIKLFYGEQYYIRIESIESHYTKAIINIPYDIN